MTLDLPDQDDLIVAVDTEGSGLHPDDGARLSTVQVAWSGGSRVYFFDQGSDTWLGPKPLPPKYPGRSLFEQDRNLGYAEWWELMEWLHRQRLVFHNAQHDLDMIATGLRGIEADTGADLSSCYIWDTMAVAPLLWPNDKVSLDFLGALVLGRGKAGLDAMHSWRKRYLGLRGPFAGRYDLVPDDIIEPYARQDPELTLDLFHAEYQLIDEGLATWESVDREIDLAVVLYNMRRVGIGLDVEAMQHEDARLTALEFKAQAELEAIVGSMRPTEATMRDYWFKRLGLVPIKTTEGGEPAVTLDVVRTLVEQNTPGAAEWQALNKVRTARKMWYGPWPALAGDDGRIRTIYRQVKSNHDGHDDSGPERGTISGRLAVERWQAQAIPHDYQIPEGIVPPRKMFRARPGYTIVEIDVSQAELRGVAGLSGCKGLLEGFAAGVDGHTRTAQLVFDVDESSARWDFYRNVAKRLNFGIVYGAGIETLRNQIEIFTGAVTTEDEVREWWSEAKAAMPEIFRMSYALRKQADKHRQIALVGGKTRYFAAYEFTHKALNACIQGSVAVAMADAMIEVTKLFGPETILLQIHDSLVCEFPTDGSFYLTEVTQAIICRIFEHHFKAPFRADAKTWA